MVEIDDGIEFLNDHYGRRWTEKIDLDRLDMSDYCNCIFGQLEGSFFAATQKWELTTRDTVRLGLEMSGDRSYDELNDAWYFYIKQDQER